MNEDLLRLQVGSVLQLQATASAQAPRFNVRVIGYLPGGSLVVTTPVLAGRLQMVREGQPFNVRMLRGNSVLGFVANVLLNNLKPYPHLHLEYPRKVESIMVRDARRANAGIFATARNTQLEDVPANRHDVTVLDLSTGGAKLALDLPIGVIGDTLQLEFSVQVAGQQETLKMAALIRNQMLRDEGEGNGPQHVCGVQFNAISRFQQLLLHGWVLERLAAAEQAVV